MRISNEQSARSKKKTHHQFDIESNWPEPIGIRRINIYWIKDVSCNSTMCIRMNDGKYSFVGMREKEAERMVKKYECEQFFYKEDSNSAALLKFAVSILQSST